MADLIPDDERGQLILLAAFVLAISFVILALVVNSAIFTENLATRGDVPGSQDALEYRDEVEKSVGSVLMTVNQDNDEEWRDENIETIAIRGGFDQSALGRVVSISKAREDGGIKFAQDNANRNFTNKSFSQEDWTLATDVDKTRNVQFEITDPAAGTGPFRFVLNQSDEDTRWIMEISENGGEVEVTVDPPAQDERTCTDSYTDSFTIDVTAGTVDGVPCPALSRTSEGQRMWLGTGIDGDYDIEFENGDAVEGTYSFITDAGAVPESANFGTAPDEPYVDNDAIYSLTVDYEFYTPSVGYETDIRVAPGEVPP